MTFLILGCGGNGSHVALALTCMGAKKLIIVDLDRVEPSNVSRQVLYTPDSVGKTKADEAKRALLSHSFNTRITTHRGDILRDRQKTDRLVRSADVVFTLTDTISSRVFAAWLCLRHGKPMVTGGTEPLGGHIAFVQFQGPSGKPCFECMEGYASRAPSEWVEYYCTTKPKKPLSREAANFEKSPLAKAVSVYYTAAIGSGFMVWHAIKYQLGLPVPRYSMTDLLESRVHHLDVQTKKDCLLCGSDRTRCD